MTGQLLDAGAQAERTALAWRRTGLGLVAVGAVLLHIGGDEPSGLPLLAVGAADLTAGAALAVLVAPLRYRRTTTAVAAERTPVGRWSCRTAAACAAATGAAAAAELVRQL